MHISIYIYSRVYRDESFTNLDVQFQEAIKLEALINKKLQKSGIKKGVVITKKSIGLKGCYYLGGHVAKIFVEVKLTKSPGILVDEKKGALVLEAIMGALRESKCSFSVDIIDLYPFYLKKESVLDRAKKAVEKVRVVCKKYHSKKEVPDDDSYKNYRVAKA